MSAKNLKIKMTTFLLSFLLLLTSLNPSDLRTGSCHTNKQRSCCNYRLCPSRNYLSFGGRKKAIRCPNPSCFRWLPSFQKKSQIYKQDCKCIQNPQNREGRSLSLFWRYGNRPIPRSLSGAFLQYWYWNHSYIRPIYQMSNMMEI